MLPYLRQANFDPHIVFEPYRESLKSPDISGLADKLIIERFHLVIFQKVWG